MSECNCIAHNMGYDYTRYTKETMPQMVALYRHILVGSSGLCGVGITFFSDTFGVGSSSAYHRFNRGFKNYCLDCRAIENHMIYRFLGVWRILTVQHRRNRV